MSEQPEFPLEQVVGIGTDLLNSQRIVAAMARHGERFVKRILTEREQQLYHQRADSLNFLAKRYAAKEAAGGAC